MADAKLGPKMQEWQVEHSNLYLKSDGKEGHVMKRTPPGGYAEMDVYSLMLTTTGRKSGEKFVFPLYYTPTLRKSGKTPLPIGSEAILLAP